MSAALQLQFFMVQAVNYLVIIVNIVIIVSIKCKNPQWCELINAYNFFIVNVFHHTSRKTSQRDVEAPEILEGLGSFKVSASVSEAATSRLGLVSDKILNVSVSFRSRRHGFRVSSRSRLRRSRAHSCFENLFLVLSKNFCLKMQNLGQKLSFG